jgi:ribosome-binding protein aMBF1 (putative translation factor)
MSSKTIPANALVDSWQDDPEFRAAYEALDEEFAIASQIIEARARAGLTQGELAKRMKTSQSSIARLESGRSKPSVTTLQKLALATNSKLRLTLEAA